LRLSGFNPAFWMASKMTWFTKTTLTEYFTVWIAKRLAVHSMFAKEFVPDGTFQNDGVLYCTIG